MDVEEALANSDVISFDDRSFEPERETDVSGTKKDTTSEREQHALVSKQVIIPRPLLPSNAFKKGVVISLPKGKALLKCVVTKNDTEPDVDYDENTDDSHSDALPLEPSKSNTSDTLPIDNNDVVTVTPSSSKGSVMTPLDSSSQNDKGNEEQVQQSPQHGSHKHHGNGFTKQFLNLFDKNMMVSLYKMAVKDILNEIHDQKKGHKRTETLDTKLKSLEQERSTLEIQYPGISKSLVNAINTAMPQPGSRKPRSIVAMPQPGSRKPRSIVNKKHVVSKNFNQRKPGFLKLQKLLTTNGTRRVKLVDTDRPLKIPQANKQTVKVTKPKAQGSVQSNLNSNDALSFYGDLDPTKLIDDGVGSPNCIDPLCVKQKQFIKHAGQYFERLDNLALEPYKKFMSRKKTKRFIRRLA